MRSAPSGSWRPCWRGPLLQTTARLAADHGVSNARTYTEEDLRELLAGLEAPDYQWEIAHPRAPGAPATLLTLVGLPRATQASRPAPGVQQQA